MIGDSALEAVLREALSLAPGPTMELVRVTVKKELRPAAGGGVRCPENCPHVRGNFICKIFDEAVGPGIPPIKCSSCLFVTLDEPERILLAMARGGE